MEKSFKLKMLRMKLEKVPIHQSIFVTSCSENLPPECEKTRLGFKNGAKGQRRCPNNIHVREFDRNICLAHMDKYDPREAPFKHLIYDVI